MNLFNLFTEIEKEDPQVYNRIDDRRRALRSMGSFSGKVLLASLPLAIGSLFKKAYGQTTPSSVLDVLNYALTLEYLEAEFYTMGVASNGLIPAADVAGITAIRDHENAHVAFLRTAIQGAGGTPVAKPTFDFTAGGAYANVFTNYDTFLAVSQAFEDTGVRAYKGQAANLVSNKAVLTAALNIHSVEARHAAHVRRVRMTRGASVKPWITGKDTGGIPSVQAVYNGEEVTTQGGVAITNINGFAISANAASEAFDEPLTSAEVLAIVRPFIK
jgi:hypothetical protein